MSGNERQWGTERVQGETHIITPFKLLSRIFEVICPNNNLVCVCVMFAQKCREQSVLYGPTGSSSLQNNLKTQIMTMINYYINLLLMMVLIPTIQLHSTHVCILSGCQNHCKKNSQEKKKWSVFIHHIVAVLYFKCSFVLKPKETVKCNFAPLSLCVLWLCKHFYMWHSLCKDPLQWPHGNYLHTSTEWNWRVKF